MSEFSRARFRLTIWYTMILFVVSVLLSSLYYWRSKQIIALQSQRLEDRIQRDLLQETVPMRTRMRAEIFETELSRVHNQLRQQIILINLLVLGFGAGASFVLAGKTLQPIERVFALQRAFISDAAHELKTPLTVLRTAIEVSLLEKKIGKFAKAVLQENLTDVANLQILTENLLSLARLREGIQTDKITLSLGEVLQTARKQVLSLARQKDIQIEIVITKERAYVTTHQQSLSRILMLLLDNAIKYSPEKSKILLSARTTRQQVFISVKDQGEGIAPKHLKAVFDRFFRISESRTKQNDVGGHGLGLSVAKELASSLGGSISLRSAIGKGSDFTISLPVG
ncbi:MAG: hypothetical protein COU67_02660 [Candidatus Pacebacteria bacterium CG10_big_fil_rev_8_21_14_0_10_44_54]|nr:HAMP domain-containing histidine kinase [bacterium]PIR60293.1 MAG: hypothetical protein COU67_02660 [Candidatus Pacebacteria bacterium CG10_big_fil_rev_8_21_14_0_10_44_54]